MSLGCIMPLIAVLLFMWSIEKRCMCVFKEWIERGMDAFNRKIDIGFLLLLVKVICGHLLMASAKFQIIDPIGRTCG